MNLLLVGLAGYFLGLATAASYAAVVILALKARRELEQSKPLTGGDIGIVHRHQNICDTGGPPAG
jgi:hypothetical protein